MILHNVPDQARLALVHSIPQRVASLRDTSLRVPSTWCRLTKVQHRTVVWRKEWLKSTVQESLNSSEVADKSWCKETWSLVEDSSGEETSGSAWRNRSEIHTKRDEVVETLVLAWNSKFTRCGEKSGNIETSGFQSVWRGTTEPVARESLVEVERCYVGEVGVCLVSTVWQGTEDEDSLGGCDSQPSDTGVEVGVGVLGLFVAGHTLFCEGGVAELATVLLGDGHEAVPAVEHEVCLVAEVVVLTRDGVVHLEETVLADTERWAESVWHTSISTTNAVLARWQITSGEQTES